MLYQLEVKRSVIKALKRLPHQVQRELSAAIDALASEPRPPDSKKSSSYELYSVRVGAYRIIYEIHDSILLIVVLKAGHRKDVYRKL